MEWKEQQFYMGVGICIAVLSFHNNYVGGNVEEVIKSTLNGAGINEQELDTYKSHFDSEDIEIIRSYLQVKEKE